MTKDQLNLVSFLVVYANAKFPDHAITVFREFLNDAVKFVPSFTEARLAGDLQMHKTTVKRWMKGKRNPHFLIKQEVHKAVIRIAEEDLRGFMN